MEMISSESYRKMNENKNLFELELEKKHLLDNIQQDENLLNDENNFFPKYELEARIQVNNQYLKEIEKLIGEKSQKKITNNIKEYINRKRYINRKKLLAKTDYLRKKQRKYSTLNEWILNELNIMENALNKGDGIDEKFVPFIRGEYLISEYEHLLSQNEYLHCLSNIYELIESDKDNVYRLQNSPNYKYSIYIYKDEKNLLLEMIKKLRARINVNGQKFLIKDLYIKAINECNIKTIKNLFFSLPIFYHDKIRAFILNKDLQENKIYYNGYILLNPNDGSILYKYEDQKLLNNFGKLNLFGEPEEKIIINETNIDKLKDRYFDLLEKVKDLYSYGDKAIINNDLKKCREFINIYKNLECVEAQILNCYDNDFIFWLIANNIIQ